MQSDGDRKGSIFSFTMKMKIPQESQIEQMVEESKDVFIKQEEIDAVRSPDNKNLSKNPPPG